MSTTTAAIETKLPEYCLPPDAITSSAVDGPPNRYNPAAPTLCPIFMSLLRLDNLSIEFGDHPILTNASLSVEPNERICLIGRNGAGKSTLLKIINREIEPDHGECTYAEHLRISKLQQSLPAEQDITVRAMVAEGLEHLQTLIDQYNTLSTSDLDENGLRELESLQSEIDAAGGWDIDKQVDTIISQLGLPAEKTLRSLSGGWRRRVALGKALVSKPELLLLDEPTNHLDITTIEWLEHTVRGYGGSVIFITHDREFLQKLATRIVEIDRGIVISWPGNYQNYLALKEKALEEEDTHNALFDKRLAGEEVWIRQGIKARRTRNEGRVRALEAMRNEGAQRVKRDRKASIHVEEGEMSGRKVIEARSITHGYNNETLLNNFKIKVSRGDRIGLVGNNGVGKSTLLKILLGQLTPDQGTVKLGTNLQIGYFDQVRRELDPNKTVADNVSDGKEFITVDGKERHIIGYLRNFLFSPKRAMSPAKMLSGGECNRVLLAKLFTRPSNLLVLDEPTNDLDVEMLEVLEAQLVEYTGTLLIVSHDRNFLDNVVTRIFVFEDDNNVHEYIGGYSDWAKRGRKLKVADSSGASINTPAITTEVATAPAAAKPKVKLSYKLQRELEQLPLRIEKLESEIQALQLKTAETEFLSQPYEATRPVFDELAAKQSALEAATERWIELEEMQG